MAFLKFTLVFVALFATTLAMNATWGSRNTTDILLMNESVVRTPVTNTFVSVDVAFPKSGQTNTRKITAIYVYDRFTNSSGATPTLWSGGPGYTTALVNLKSQMSRGINSTVEIWGKN
ncbi:probable salivary secreted peptide [Musca autumnalis]|uniref:probable salivary secreted peptide n=1 Tax=Musca autumnalis TaxID=221902 RepID=UPI003CE7E4D1